MKVDSVKLKKVTITGPDNQTSIDDLNTITKEFPYVEWGILFDSERLGKNRYPDIDQIKNFSQNHIGKTISMHLCNQSLIKFSTGDKEIFDVMSDFDCVQLNVTFGGAGNKVDPVNLASQVKSMPDKEFIIQYNDEQKQLLDHFSDTSNVVLIFDRSAGSGMLPRAWPEPIKGYGFGYAGGLNPQNVVEQVEKMKDVASGHEIWIDMETGVRTDDVFDLGKVRAVLKAMKPYMV